MKTLMYRFSLLIVLVLGFTACEKDEDDPDFDFRDEYVGDWNAQFNSTEFSTQTYTVSISKVDDNPDQVRISGFYNMDGVHSVVANVSDNDIVIGSQTVNNITFEGTGNSNADYSTINLTYTAFDGAETDNVTAIYGKSGLRLPWEDEDVEQTDEPVVLMNR